MKQLLSLVQHLAKSDMPVLITAKLVWVRSDCQAIHHGLRQYAAVVFIQLRSIPGVSARERASS
jgi:hypothetical protein